MLQGQNSSLAQAVAVWKKAPLPSFSFSFWLGRHSTLARVT